MKRLIKTGSVGLFVLLASSSLFGQAWVFPQGSGIVTVSFQNAFVHDHVDQHGHRYDFGHLSSHMVTVDTDYSLTDRLALKIEVPYVISKYDGAFPHQLPIDDGSYHSTFQDLSVDVRYNLKSRPLVLTPFFRAGVPSHSYEYFAHSAAGRDQREYAVGVNAGRRLDPILPKLYLQGRYSYAFVEQIVGIAPRRSDSELQLGYYLTPRWTALANGQWAHTHNGVLANFDIPPPAGLTPEQWVHHDQISKATRIDVSGGIVHTLSESTDVYMSVGRSIHGTNGHVNSFVATVGISRSFGTHFATARAATGDGPGPAPQAAFVCTCAK